MGCHTKPARGAAITGWGAALPHTVVTNVQLEAHLDTTDEWITERTGIKERRVGGTTAGLAIEAGAAALASAGYVGQDIDQVLLATTTPDRQLPATASTVQAALGVDGGALDINAACSGFVYGLVHAHGLIAVGAERVLLIGAETLSRITDGNDRNTAILFADGAGAVVVEAVDGPGELLGWDLGSDGTAEELLYADLGGYVQMEGREVFRRAVRATVDSSHRALQRAGVSPEEVALVVPHQANMRILEAACQRLGIPIERTATVLQSTGNTSAASIPLAMVDAIEARRLQPDDLVLMVGFGAGMSWASAVIRWSADREADSRA
jgi:3-oxoacyl-[acyl-carrier-protein] synthase-3